MKSGSLHLVHHQSASKRPSGIRAQVGAGLVRVLLPSPIPGAPEEKVQSRALPGCRLGQSLTAGSATTLHPMLHIRPCPP